MHGTSLTTLHQLPAYNLLEPRRYREQVWSRNIFAYLLRSNHKLRKNIKMCPNIIKSAAKARQCQTVLQVFHVYWLALGHFMTYCDNDYSQDWNIRCLKVNKCKKSQKFLKWKFVTFSGFTWWNDKIALWCLFGCHFSISEPLQVKLSCFIRGFHPKIKVPKYFSAYIFDFVTWLELCVLQITFWCRMCEMLG